MARQKPQGAGEGRRMDACALGRALECGLERARVRGFTLLEAMVALAIVAVLLRVTAPSWSSWLQRRHLQAEAEALLGSLALARAQALMQQQRVTLCPSRTGAVCETEGTGPSQGAWEVGWIVFVDRNRNGLREAEEPLLQQRPASPKGVHIIGRSTLSQAIAYGIDGGSEGVHGQFLAGTLQLCAQGQAEGWQLVLNPLGRARLARAEVGTCP